MMCAHHKPFRFRPGPNDDAQKRSTFLWIFYWFLRDNVLYCQPAQELELGREHTTSKVACSVQNGWRWILLVINELFEQYLWLCCIFRSRYDNSSSIYLELNPRISLYFFNYNFRYLLTMHEFLSDSNNFKCIKMLYWVIEMGGLNGRVLTGYHDHH